VKERERERARESGPKRGDLDGQSLQQERATKATQSNQRVKQQIVLELPPSLKPLPLSLSLSHSRSCSVRFTVAHQSLTQLDRAILLLSNCLLPCTDSRIKEFEIVIPTHQSLSSLQPFNIDSFDSLQTFVLFTFVDLQFPLKMKCFLVLAAILAVAAANGYAGLGYGHGLGHSGLGYGHGLGHGGLAYGHGLGHGLGHGGLAYGHGLGHGLGHGYGHGLGHGYGHGYGHGAILAAPAYAK
jgi:hypothetical protein